MFGFGLSFPPSPALLANGKGIRLSALSFQAGSAQGTAIGTLSVVGGTGTYTFTLTDTAGSKAQVAGTNGVNLQAGATSASVGSFNITVHASSSAGVAFDFDATFSIVAWSAVSNSIAPAISGSAKQGVTLSVSNGTWSGSPTPSFSYQWKRAGSTITGATSSTYTLQSADVGSAITCTVTASNGFSSASATSSATTSVTKTTLSYSPVTSATQGSAYTGATPTTTNGTVPYTYSVTGTLPAGLALNASTGVISGTPTTVQTVSGIALVVTDANGVTDSSSTFSIAVANASSPAPGAPGSLSNRSANTNVTPTIRVPLNTAGGNLSNIASDVMYLYADGVSVANKTLNSTDISNGYVDLTSTEQFGLSTGFTARSIRSGTYNSPLSSALNVTYDVFVLVGYGQSWMGGYYTSSSGSPPAAAAGTSYWHPTNGWTTVPAADGARTICNKLVAGLNKPVRFIVFHKDGASSTELLPGGAWFPTLDGYIRASGVNHIDAIFYHQHDYLSSASTYAANVGTIHSTIMGIVGQTTANAPFVLSGSSPHPNDPNDTYNNNNETWSQFAAKTLTNAFYSHSNVDAWLLPDNLHYLPGYNAISCARYANTILWRYGKTAGPSSFYATAASYVSSTKTSLTLTHTLGTDFTPSSGITGFDVSSDSGGTWHPATAVKTSATGIELTHDNIGTGDRNVRYMFGKNPNISRAVYDNSVLTVPLVPTGDNWPLAKGPSVAPTLTYHSTGNAGQGATVSRTGVNLGTFSEDRLLIVGLGSYNTPGSGAHVSACTLTPNGGSPISGSVVVTSSGSSIRLAAICSILIPAGTNVSNCTIAATLAGNPFANVQMTVWSVPVATLSSTTPVGSAWTNAASSKTASVSINTAANGVLVAVQSFVGSGGGTADWSASSETLIKRFDNGQTQGNSAADASGISGAGTASISVTVTSGAGSGFATGLAAASWR